MRSGVAQGGINSPVHLRLYVNHMPVPSRHVEPGLYADDTAVMATFPKPELLFSNLELYLSDLERCLKEWRIAIKSLRALQCSFLSGASKNPDQ